MKYLTKEDVFKYEHHLTFKDLKDFVENNQDLPDNTPVLCERVEDIYFEKHNWDVFLIEGEHYHSMVKRNKDMLEEVERIKNGEDREYPMIKNPMEVIATDEQLNTLKEQFFNSWCITRDKKNEIILIHNHY